MTEVLDFETYLYISKDEFQIFLFDKRQFKNLYNKKLKVNNKLNFQDSNEILKFLDDNIFKIEKLVGNFIKNIYLIIESNENFYVDIGIKKKSYENLINKNFLENTLTELKDLFKENYQEANIMHMVVNKYLIDKKRYSFFKNDLNSDNLCLEVNFKSIPNELTFQFDKILEKYQIKISQYLDANYIRNFFKESNIEISEMAHKLKNGHNTNEVKLVPKNIENKGFFEKFFQLFG